MRHQSSCNEFHVSNTILGKVIETLFFFFSSSTENVPVGGSTSLFTNRKMAFSELRFMCWRISKMNFPTLMSDGTRNFFLSRSGTSLFGAFSTITGMRSGYFARIRWATFCLSSLRGGIDKNSKTLCTLYARTKSVLLLERLGCHFVSCEAAHSGGRNLRTCVFFDLFC